jgi:hypothetical protein
MCGATWAGSDVRDATTDDALAHREGGDNNAHTCGAGTDILNASRAHGTRGIERTITTGRSAGAR